MKHNEGTLGDRPSLEWEFLLNRLQFCASVWASFTRRLRPHLLWLHEKRCSVNSSDKRWHKSFTYFEHGTHGTVEFQSSDSWIFTSVLVGSSPRSNLLGWFYNRTGTSVDDGTQIKQLAWPITERQIEHRKSCLVLLCLVPVLLLNQPIYFRDGPYDTAAKYGTEFIRYGTLHFRDRRGAASLRHRNCAAYNRSNVCEQTLYPVWFSWQRVNILTLNKVRLIMINLLNVVNELRVISPAASFHVCENTATKQNLQPNK